MKFGASPLDSTNVTKGMSNEKQLRPDYPATLFQYLAMMCDDHSLAWDVGTGTGNIAKGIAPHFNRVLGTDKDPMALAQATPRNNIDYCLGDAEKAELADASVDLVCVGQTLHWLDRPAFFAEVDRVLKPGGVMAIMSYHLLTINSEIDQLINHLYHHKLGEHWSDRRKLVESNFADVTMPFDPVPCQDFEMVNTWNYNQVVSYVNNWSAVKRYEKENERSPLREFNRQLEFSWCDTHHLKKVHWPLHTIIRRKPV